MNFLRTDLTDVVIVEPDINYDDRGFFLEAYSFERYKQNGIPVSFLQDNHSKSQKYTLRGLHAQRKNPQGKLIRVIEGEIYDVAVDIRPNSSTFKKWIGIIISAENFKQIYIPPGFAHGFCVISEIAQVEYKCTAYYDPNDEIHIRWDDPVLGIKWPVANPILSIKDSLAPYFLEIQDTLL